MFAHGEVLPPSEASVQRLHRYSDVILYHPQCRWTHITKSHNSIRLVIQLVHDAAPFSFVNIRIWGISRLPHLLGILGIKPGNCVPGCVGKNIFLLGNEIWILTAKHVASWCPVMLLGDINIIVVANVSLIFHKVLCLPKSYNVTASKHKRCCALATREF